MNALPGKLVRDGIPEVIRQGGQTPILDTVTLDNRAEYIRMKLLEEFNEYAESGDVTDLADIVEVCFTAAAWQGASMLALLTIAYKKRLERGSFQSGIVWLGNENSVEQTNGASR